MATSMGVTSSVLQSKQFKKASKEGYEGEKLELFKWAKIDPAVKTI